MKSPTFVPLEKSPLFCLQSRARLALILGLSPRELERLVKLGIIYSEWDESKPNGGTRRIENPNRQLKVVQARIARLLSAIAPPDYLYCPVRGRSAFDNAKVHAGNRIVRNLDIRKYYPSTTEKRVIWFFHKYMGCSIDVTFRLAKIACYNQHLPTGSPLSPILSFYAHKDMWDEIGRLCEEARTVCSVWIDDITVSGNHVSDALVWKLKQEISRAGLRYHKERQAVDKPARVTGIIVTPDGRMALPHRHFKKLREAQSELAVAYSGGQSATFAKLEGRVKGLQGHGVQLERAKAQGRA